MPTIGNVNNMQYAYAAMDTRSERAIFNNAIRDLRKLGYSGKAQISSAGQILNKDEMLNFINGLNKNQITRSINELKKYLQPSPAVSGDAAETLTVQRPEDIPGTVGRLVPEVKFKTNKTFNVVLPSGNYYTVDTGNPSNASSVFDSLETIENTYYSELTYQEIGTKSAEDIASIISRRNDHWEILNKMLSEDPAKGISVFHNITWQSQSNFVKWLINTGKVSTCKAMLQHYEGSPAEGKPIQMNNLCTYLGYIDTADRKTALQLFKGLQESNQSAIMEDYYQFIKGTTLWAENNPHPFVKNTAFFFTALKQIRPADAQNVITAKRKMINSGIEELAAPWKDFFKKISPQIT
jgi:hypothetical protein